MDRLKQVYKHVDDIDLWIGGLAETPVQGSLLGHTFLCIVGDQFIRLRKGDRFYYELGNMKHSFSKDQLEEIRRVTLARIFCDNSEEFKSTQPLTMFNPSIMSVDLNLIAT